MRSAKQDYHQCILVLDIVMFCILNFKFEIFILLNGEQYMVTVVPYFFQYLASIAKLH